MQRHRKLVKPGPVSQAATARSDFEFPTANPATAAPSDVVFCGKVISRQIEPGPAPPQRSQSSGRTNGFTSGLRSPSCNESRYRKIGGGSRKHYNGMFGTIKFPLQMDLSDMKMRRERRESMPLPKPPVTVEDDGGDSCWELVRPFRRRGTLMSALAKAACRCIPIL